MRGIGAGLATLIKMPFAVCCVSVPLGLWEAVERIGRGTPHFSAHKRCQTGGLRRS
jgi:hypothetical protein